MKRNRFVFFCLLFYCGACNNNTPDTPAPKTESEDVVAVTNFIRAALDGKFDEARRYLLPDSINTNYVDVVERSYVKMSQEVKDGYRTSSIHFYDIKAVNDSIRVVVYANSFKNDKDTLKALKIGGKWLVDLKYLYQHDMDTVTNKPPIPLGKDSLP